MTEEQKEAYSAVVENLQRPSKTTYAGAAVPSNETQRMLAHSETERALTATNDLAREIAEAETPSGDQTVSKKTLEYFLNKAQAYVEGGAVDSCVESVQKLFEEAIAEGKAVMADEDATRDEVMDASLKLLKAIHALDMKAANKTDLEMAAELADMIDLSKYVEAGQKEFKDALAAAKEVLADGDAMQDEVDAAWDELAAAMENLRLKADKEILEGLLDELAGLDLSQYTEESAAAFRAALASAQAVYADETLSVMDQQKVDDAVAALKDAKDGLTAKADDSDDGEGSGQKPDTDKPGTGTSGSDSSQTDNGIGSGNQAAGSSTPKTGDSTPILVVLAVIAMAAAVAGIVVRKRFRA